MLPWRQRRMARCNLIAVTYIVFSTVMSLMMLLGDADWMRWLTFQSAEVGRVDEHVENITVRWRDVPITCPPKMRFLAGDNLPVIGLVSYPGSGHTWLRHLLHISTGIYTGSIYQDDALAQGGIPGEGVADGRVLVVTCHSTHVEELARYDRMILLTRHPRAVLLANYSHAGHTGQAISNGLKAHAPTLLETVQMWKLFHEIWLAHYERPMLIVRYEDLNENLAWEMYRILTFLGWRVTPGLRRCLETHSQRAFHRKHDANEDPYPPDIREQMEVDYQYIDELIKRYTRRNRFHLRDGSRVWTL